MKSKFLLMMILTVLIITACGSGRIDKTIYNISESVKAEYCPDQRISIWNISVKRDRGDFIVSGETDHSTAREVFEKKVKESLPKKKITFAIKLLPDDTVGQLHFGMLKTSTAKMRSGTSIFKDITSETIMGLPLEILKEEEGCFLVRSDDGYLGWIDKDQIIQGSDSLKLLWDNSEKVVFTGVEGIVHSEPSFESDPVSDCVMGNWFIALGKSGSWTKVAYLDDRIGFIPTKQLVTADDYLARKLEPEKVIKTAKSLLGRPYLWGTASAKEMDCSGFTQTVFRNNGYILPRDANMQVNEGTEVDTSGFFKNLQPGDLLFFGHSNEKITHVGLYIGGYEFIHCSGKVRIDSFDHNAKNFSDYRKNGLRKVKRIVN
ncbi:MAG: C40 family peptidase [Candidatus Marinimicrobia bacterium]|nr:C40 family peptidase [Candidatus Neomarinimicrobiota bacterium]